MHPSRRLRCAGMKRHLSAVLILVVGFVAFALDRAADLAGTEGSDDYPARLKAAAQDALVDPWMFYNRECTSFVAWRLNHDAGVDFSNYYLGVHWGDASNWKYAANQVGVPVDASPTRRRWPGGPPARPDRRAATSPGCCRTPGPRSRSRSTTTSPPATTTSEPSPRLEHVAERVHPHRRCRCSNTAAPAVFGKPKVGARLTARPGSWTPSGATYSYQWLGDGVAINGTPPTAASRPAGSARRAAPGPRDREDRRLQAGAP